MPGNGQLYRVAVFLIAALLSVNLYSQDSADSFSTVVIEPTATAIEQIQSMTDDARADATQTLASAGNLISQTIDRSERIAQYEDGVANNEAMTAQIAADFVAADTMPELPPDSADVGTLSSQLNQLEAELLQVTQLLANLREQEIELENRPVDIAEEIANARQAAAGLTSQSFSELLAIDDLAIRARSILAQAQRIERSAAVEDLQRELVTVPSRLGVVQDRINLAQTRVGRLQSAVSILTQRLNDTRLGSAQTAIDLAQSNLDKYSQQWTMLKPIAEENLALARQLRTIAKRNSFVAQDTSVYQQELEGLRKSQEIVSRIFATGSQTEELSQLLRNVESSLPRESQIREILGANEETRIRMELNQIIWQDRVQNLNDSRAALNRLLASGAVVEISDELLAESEPLINHRKQLLTRLIDSAQIGSESLVEQSIALRSELAISVDLSELLKRRSLWLKNDDPLTSAWWSILPQGVAWLFNPASWRLAIFELFKQIGAQPLLAILAFLPPLAFLRVKKPINERIKTLSGKVGNVGQDRYWVTPLAMLCCLALAMPWPYMIAATAALLALGEDLQDFTLTLTLSLTALSTLLFLIFLFKALSRSKGVFQLHFGWSEKATRDLRRNLNWFALLEGAMAFIFTMAISSSDPTLRFSLGLFSFVIASTGIAVLSYQFFKPRAGIISSIVVESTVSPLMIVVFPFLVLAPLITGIIPLFGYFDAAIELQTRIFVSGIVVLGTAIAYGLIMRLLMIANRRLALRKAREKRVKIELSRAANVDAIASGDAVPQNVLAPELDPEYISLQVRRMTKIFAGITLILGLWITWNPLLPALGVADDLVLWQSLANVDGVEYLTEVTLWNVLLSVFLLIGGIIAARNIGGFLEISVFSRMRLDAGARYAAVTIAGYILVATGIIGGFSQLGINWSNLQWIIAALGVGLGFGLQEIVANFVSGIIILFERPVRVGDVVTIGELSGTVSNIRIRAATITDFDNREVLLPNKTIITENVTNWTLNDAVTRLIIKVGVAYGSDIEKVHDLIMQVVDSCDEAMDTPPATVFFMNHGESSLDFELRVFVNSPSKRLPVTHQLNLGINRILAQNGIEIPFPQRDLHIKSQQVLPGALKAASE